MIKVLPKLAVKYFFLAITCIVLLLYLPALISFWLSPKYFWFIGFFSLTFPYTTILLFLLCIFWFIAKPKIGWVILLFLILGFKNYSTIFGTTINKDFVIDKQKNSIRIATWNIQSFNGLSKNKEAKKNIKADIVDCIEKYQPDIVCLQEFNTSFKKNDAADNVALFKKQYPYYYFSEDYGRKNGSYKSGCIIFSSLPIIATGKIKYPIAESLIYADVLKDNDTIRVYTTHLQSFKFKKQDYDEIDNISVKKEASKASMSLFRKMKNAFQLRAAQADIVKNELQQCSYASIICGDFNDVPASYTYYTIKGKRNDVFLNKEFGIGRTFISLAPTLRIDYILPDKNFITQQFDLIDENLSDHIMLIADVAIKK